MSNPWSHQTERFFDQPKRKVDREALSSPFMRIPRMKVDVARDLIDLGFEDLFDLHGRSPEVMLEELGRLRQEVPADRIAYFRMAVYFVETSEPEARLCHPSVWMG